MEQTTKHGQVFLEVMRIRSNLSGKAQVSKLRYAAWCQRCEIKVSLVPQNGVPFSSSTGALHVSIVFSGEMLVCSNSLTGEAKRNQ